MKHNLTKLEQEKWKRMTVLGLVAACSMAIMLIINIKYMETLSLGLRMTTLILLCTAVIIAAVRVWAVNDNYRIVRQEIIRKNGQMPYSRTYFFVQHKICGCWFKCKDKYLANIKFKTRKEAEAFMQENVNRWAEQG